ncbi:hypothetical protein DRJ04_02135 [Candidatus Aerophobetes bacterium]|uniref:Uncharacterized protein n=1 Tax=Aerophobetes bacterium TaxID=2030807 RepID=A0A662DL22_UNCAE|nr:MAG: hypothetical protein DRJ04_02135 [Candidatus Aerophobetes bacterium]
MIYIEEFFSVSFEGEEKITDNPVPYGKLCRTNVEKTRYVGIARIRRLEPQNYRLEGITIIILPGKDSVTGEKRKKIMAYARALAGKRYARILKGNFPIHIDPHISDALRDAALWMPSKGMVYHMEEIIEDMLLY